MFPGLHIVKLSSEVQRVVGGLEGLTVWGRDLSLTCGMISHAGYCPVTCQHHPWRVVMKFILLSETDNNIIL